MNDYVDEPQGWELPHRTIGNPALVVRVDAVRPRSLFKARPLEDMEPYDLLHEYASLQAMAQGLQGEAAQVAEMLAQFRRLPGPMCVQGHGRPDPRSISAQFSTNSSVRDRSGVFTVHEP